MESGPLSSPEFKEFAKDVVLFCHITTQIPGRKHDGLLSEKGGRGFPHLVIMDSKGDVLSTVPGRSVDVFRTSVTEAQAYLDLSNKADRTPDEDVKLIEAELNMGKLKAADAAKRLDGVTGADEATVAKVRETIAAKEFDEVINTRLDGARQAPSREAAQAMASEIGKEFWEHYQAGKRPSGDVNTATAFYSLIMQHGITSKEAGPARAGYDGLEELHGSSPGARAQLDKIKAQVEEVEAGK